MSKGQANPYPLRLPIEVMDKLKVIAKENSRSINSEILYQTKRVIAEYEAEHGQIELSEGE